MTKGSIYSAKRTGSEAQYTSPRVKVQVTQEHIDTATPKDSSHCMVADAVRDAVPTAQYISVDLATIRFTDPEAGLRYIYLTPRRPQMELVNFDQGIKSEPFSFELRGAHVLLTGSAKRAKSSPAKLMPAPDGGNTPPIRVGGEAPPVGPLAGGAPIVSDRPNVNSGRGAGAGGRTGKRREFGLRAIVR